MSDEKTPLTEEEAAVKIQRMWRRHSDITIFQRLKHLVEFRNQGDPATLLKVINPIEAQLLDAAVGAHVRFRLGGFEWPPQIYYKIFLHSPICDVNSYAPRNYSDKAAGSVPPISPEQLAEATEKYGWYRRIENNGWRPISSLSPTAIDAITQMTNKTPPRKRVLIKPKKAIKGEVARLKLQRFLQQQNEQRARNKDGVMLTEADFDDEELLNWAQKLDLDQYRTDWETIGTTGPSSKIWWNIDIDDVGKHPAEDESSGSDIDEEELMRLLN
jgi:hypothetical protein